MDNSLWFQHYSAKKNSEIRLFCFPYAGGRAEIFQSWQQAIDPAVEVIAVNYPGRGKRIGATPITDCKTLVTNLLPEFMAYTDKPFAFFGHSMGALVSFELASQLQVKGISGLKHLFLSARRAVHLPFNNTNFHTLPDDEFVNMLQKLGGTPQEVFDHPELMALLIPILRGDFMLSETYCYQAGTRLKTNTSILYSNEDQYVQKEQVTGWQDVIEGQLDFTEFPGGHFFMHSQQHAVTNLVKRRLFRQDQTSLASNGINSPRLSSEYDSIETAR